MVKRKKYIALLFGQYIDYEYEEENINIGGMGLIEIEDRRLREAISWLLFELDKIEYGGATLNVTVHKGGISLIERSVKQKEKPIRDKQHT